MTYVVKRLVASLIVMFATSIIIFAVMRLAPGDPALELAGPDATPDQVEAIRQQLGLSGPLIQQYVSWLQGIFTGDFGVSYLLKRPITDLIGQRLQSTLQLALLALLIKVFLGTVIGVVTSATRFRWLRNAVDVASTMLLATPTFVSAVFMIFLFAVVFRVLPSGGQVNFFEDPTTSLQFLIMPAVAIALPGSTIIGRLLATEMRRSFQEEYVRTAQAKGASRFRIIVNHVLPNSLGPALIQVGFSIGDILGGAVIAEVLFSRAGMGSLLVSSVKSRDYLLAEDLLLFVVGTAIIVQLVTELAVARIDRRIVLSGAMQ